MVATGALKAPPLLRVQVRVLSPAPISKCGVMVARKSGGLEKAGSIPVTLTKIWPVGGIGRHSGFKTHRLRHVGSSPTRATILIYFVATKWFFFKDSIRFNCLLTLEK